MTQTVQFVSRDGTPWEPEYLETINAMECIGCGRCYKVCHHGVLKMMGLNEDDELIEADDDDVERMVMAIADKGKCIGCKACATVCGKTTQTFIPASQLHAA
jgi:Nif-specific ferredoxin III